ncbi:hypothetical protein [Paraclostridium sordellii]|uniref:hypothetical protein n=1 Tax=Paraclostridium sordellii TaxID=1505 RepID=UPI0005DB2D48|nr:hypothetical protein [Paeniclostridium sordellii]CEO23403.1 Uncharacterised protein [[Clostridium] sordellii] [Paeniclostridium sordellii]
MNFKKLKSGIALSLIIATVSIPFSNSIFALEIANSTTPTEFVENKNIGIDEVSEFFGLTSNEKNEFKKSIDEYKKEEQLRQEREYKIYGNQFGKLSLSTKAMRKIWRKLPFKVRKTIVQHTGLTGAAAIQSIVSTVDHFTGSVEDGVYKACKKLGMNNHYSWWVTKTITLFLL